MQANPTSQSLPHILIVGAGPAGLEAYNQVKDLPAQVTIVEQRPETDLEKRTQILFLHDSTINGLPDRVRDYLFCADKPKVVMGEANNVIPFRHSVVRIQELVRGYLDNLPSGQQVQRNFKLVDLIRQEDGRKIATFLTSHDTYKDIPYDILVFAGGFGGVRRLPAQLLEKLDITHEEDQQTPAILSRYPITYDNSLEAKPPALYPQKNPHGLKSMLFRTPDNGLYAFSSVPEQRVGEVEENPRRFAKEVGQLYGQYVPNPEATEAKFFPARWGHLNRYFSEEHQVIFFGDSAAAGLFFRGIGFNLCAKVAGLFKNTMDQLLQKNLPTSEVLEQYQQGYDSYTRAMDFFRGCDDQR